MKATSTMPEQKPIVRNGKACKVLAEGNPRRLSDARNAIRKMNEAQLKELRAWMHENGYC